MPYQDPSDFRLLPEMARLAPREAQGFLAFDGAAGRSDGAIPPKYRELIALAVALTTGATREELAETAFIAAALRAGAALGHGLMMLRLAEGGGRADRSAPPA